MSAAHDLPGEVAVAHDRAVAAGSPTYRDPATGYSVFTAVWLAARRTCCDSGCRHCPYGDSDGTTERSLRP